MREFIKEYLKNRPKVCPKELNIKIRKASVTIHRVEKDSHYLSSEIYFDLAGNKLECKSFYEGKILAWEKFIYNKTNELVEVVSGVPILNEGGNDESDFYFSTKPVLTITEEEGEVHVNESGQKVISIFNSSGELSRRKIFNKDNVCIDITDYAGKIITYRELYDRHGQIMEARKFRSDGQPLNCLTNTFNKNSQLCRSKYVSRTGYITHDTVLKYNDRGLLSEIIEHPRDPDKAFADLKGGSSGCNHKYYYRQDMLLDIDDVYQCGKHVRSHKYSYDFW